MAPTAPAALLCGDPARALVLAQELLTEPRMSNHHRGLWGYHGHTPEGGELTVQATGIGGPSAAAVLAELVVLGVRAVVRVGTCRAERPGPRLGACLAAARVFAGEGAAAAYGAVPELPYSPDPGLAGHLRERLDGDAEVLSADTWGAPVPVPATVLGAAGRVRDLQSGAVAALADRHGLSFAAALVVAATPAGRLEDGPLEAAALRAGRAAAGALTAAGSSRAKANPQLKV